MAAHVQVRKPAGGGESSEEARLTSTRGWWWWGILGYSGVGEGCRGPSATPRLIPRQTLFWSPAALGARHGEETEPVKDCFTPAG